MCAEYCFIHGCDIWVISTVEKRKLEAFEMWCYRKMLKIKWIERITDEAVLDRIKEKRELWHTIKVRRDKMTGHLLRHDSLTKSVVSEEEDRGWSTRSKS